MDKERFEKVKRMVISFLRGIKSPKCMPISRLEKELKSLHALEVAEYYEIEEVAKSSPELEIIKAGWYVWGLVREDMICLEGEKDRLMLSVSQPTLCVNDMELPKKVEGIEKRVRSLEREVKEIKEITDDIYYYLLELKRKFEGK